MMHTVIINGFLWKYESIMHANTTVKEENDDWLAQLIS